MNEDTTDKLPKAGGNSFEETVLASLDGIRADVQGLRTQVADLDERVQRLEAKAYDTKPIWENALKEIAETRIEMREGFSAVNKEFDKVRGEMRDGFANSHSELRRLERKFLVFHDSLLDIRTDLRELDERLQKVEPETVI